MAIPLELQVAIAASGLEVFQQVQQGIQATAAQAMAARGLSDLATGLNAAAFAADHVTPALANATQQLQGLSTQAGLITPAALDTLADAFAGVRTQVLEQSSLFQTLRAAGADYNTSLKYIIPTERELVVSLEATTNELREKALVLQTTTQLTGETEQATRRVTAATNLDTTAKGRNRAAYYHVINAMNLQSSAAAGMMLGMSALRGNITGVGFGLVFLRFSIWPVTLAIAALTMGLGGVVKVLSSVSEKFLPQAAESMGRLKDVFDSIIDTFAGPVWMNIILPLIDIMASYAEQVEKIAYKVRYSAEMQERWQGVIQTFMDLLTANKTLFAEHGDVIEGIITVAYKGAFTSLEILMESMRICLELLPIFADAWAGLGKALEPIAGLFDAIGIELNEISFADALINAAEWRLEYPEVIRSALVAVISVLKRSKGGVKLAIATFVGDMLIEFLPLEEGVKEMWQRTWSWATLGAAIGMFFGPAGIAIGAGVGTLIGFLDNLFEGKIGDWFNENLPLIFSGAAVGAAIGSMVPAVGTAIGALAGAIIGALVGWILPIKDELAEFFGYIWDLFVSETREFVRNAEEFFHDVWDAFIRGLKDLVTTNPPPSPEVPKGGTSPSLSSGGAPTIAYSPLGQAAPVMVNVYVTGNNIWNEEAVREITNRVGDKVVSRISSRYGVAVR